MTILDNWKMNKAEILQYCIDEFPVAYGRAMNHCGITLQELNTTEDPQVIGQFCQTMWEALPDNSSIRKVGFFLLCDIAEEYCFGEN